MSDTKRRYLVVGITAIVIAVMAAGGWGLYNLIPFGSWEFGLSNLARRVVSFAIMAALALSCLVTITVKIANPFAVWVVAKVTGFD